MRVLQIKIENFRGIKNADVTFDGHTVMVSGNNVGKSTVCDALDLVLGTDPKGRNQPGANVRGSLKLPKWKAIVPQLWMLKISPSMSAYRPKLPMEF